MTLQRTATLCLDFHGNIVDVEFLALRSSHRELHILIGGVVNAGSSPCTRTSGRCYQCAKAINIAVSLQSFVFYCCCCSIAVDGSLRFIGIIQCPCSRKRVATAQLNAIDGDSSIDRLRAYRCSNGTIEGTGSRDIHFGIERLDERAVLVVDRE